MWWIWIKSIVWYVNEKINREWIRDFLKKNSISLIITGIQCIRGSLPVSTVWNHLNSLISMEIYVFEIKGQVVPHTVEIWQGANFGSERSSSFLPYNFNTLFVRVSQSGMKVIWIKLKLREITAIIGLWNGWKFRIKYTLFSYSVKSLGDLWYWYYRSK